MELTLESPFQRLRNVLTAYLAIRDLKDGHTVPELLLSRKPPEPTELELLQQALSSLVSLAAYYKNAGALNMTTELDRLIAQLME